LTEIERHQHEVARAQSRTVRLLAADGMRWVVREVAAPSFDRRGGTHLVFDGELVMRRVRNFPPDWYLLSDDDLYALTARIER
jgi:hypothetical protein